MAISGREDVERRGTYHQNLTEQLQKTVLAWSYWALQGSGILDNPVVDTLEKVPASFEDFEHYVRVYEKFVLEECAALTQKVEGDSLAVHNCVVVSMRERTGFLDVTFVLRPEDTAIYNENDLVLLSSNDPMDVPMEPADKAALSHALGWIQNRDGESSVVVRFYLQESDHPPQSLQARRCQLMRHLLTDNSCWKLLRLCNMVTVTREWIALHMAGSLPFRNVLITPGAARPSPSAPPRAPLHVPPLMKSHMSLEYNDSQMAAIEAGLDGTPLVLIQGPPGTGKTKTILGLLSIILHAAPPGVAALTREPTGSALEPVDPVKRQQLWLQAAPWLVPGSNPRDVRGPRRGRQDDAYGLTRVATPVKISSGSDPKPHVLVCAPSNSALDEIVSRLLRFGLIDRQGRKYAPSIIRVGLSVHHSVQSVSLDAAVEQRLKASADPNDPQGPSRVARDRARVEVLEEADIVCSTLSFSGSGIFAKVSRGFDVVVIDEAAQAVEPSTMVPLVPGVQQVYLVGDPEQLPATVLSTRASSHGYDISMFKRLQVAGYPVQILDMQYRMHPSIAEFPSQTFYSGKLLNGEGVLEATTRPWHTHGALGPLAFYDVRGRERTEEGSTSLVNDEEAKMVMFLYAELVTRYSQLSSGANIAVISPYKAQVKLLRDSFKRGLGEESAKAVDINTIDGFQGREKDIVIFSPVRTRTKGSIGFVADERRINVGLTRARSSLLVVGHGEALRRDPRWSAFYDFALNKRCVWRVQRPYDTFLERAIDGAVAPQEPRPQQGSDDGFVAGHEPGFDYDDEDEAVMPPLDDPMDEDSPRRNAAPVDPSFPASSGNHADISSPGPSALHSSVKVPVQMEDPCDLPPAASKSSGRSTRSDKRGSVGGSPQTAAVLESEVAPWPAKRKRQAKRGA